jgi:hypothetical protein
MKAKYKVYVELLLGIDEILPAPTAGALRVKALNR